VVYKFLSSIKNDATHTQMQDAAQLTSGFFTVVSAAVADHKEARPDMTAVYGKKYPSDKIVDWTPPEILRHPHTATQITPDAYTYDPAFRSKKPSTPESRFESEIVKRVTAGDVEWWFKNGDSGREHFAVAYRHKKGWLLFYPDFIIKWKDGILGVYETKSPGDTDPKTADKAPALAKWFTDHGPVNGRTVEQGICVEYPDHGGWHIHSGIGKYSNPPKDSPESSSGNTLGYSINLDDVS
jgi:hypothetical protein